MTDLLKQRAFAAVDKKLRPAAIAEIGGFRPRDDPRASWFGGKFVLPVGERWPTSNQEPMIPLLQIAVDELPYRPPQFEGVAIVQIFVDSKKLPKKLPAKNHEGWLIVLRPEAGHLQPHSTPPEATRLRPFPVRWRRIENDAPSWDEAWEDGQHDEFMQRDDASDLYEDNYNNHPSTKIGGWPFWVQGAAEPGGERFVLQIASEDKPRWIVGDNGKLYVFEVEGEWWLQWDCY